MRVLPLIASADPRNLAGVYRGREAATPTDPNELLDGGAPAHILVCCIRVRMVVPFCLPKVDPL